MAATIYDLEIERIVRAIGNGDFATLAKIGSATRNRAKIQISDEAVKPHPVIPLVQPTPGRNHRRSSAPASTPRNLTLPREGTSWVEPAGTQAPLDTAGVDGRQRLGVQVHAAAFSTERSAASASLSSTRRAMSAIVGPLGVLRSCSQAETL